MTMRRLAVSLTALVVLIGAPAHAALTQSVKITGGLVSGAAGRNPSITVFKGLPFAAPPVGNLRWRAPAPVVPWAGEKKADRFGNSCIQSIVQERKPWTYEFMAHNEVSEDCLYLNVWTGAKSATERRAVYLYIHGGGNREGSGGIQVYDGEGLANKGVIVVTLNYRLGVFGFFVHPELTKESGVNASGNYALLDIVAALRWIHDNIAAFGGDPTKVTIGGQSAGAGNTHSMVASPLAKGLFRGAIAESGSSYGPGNVRSLAEAESSGVKFAEAKGARSLAELRQMSWPTIFEPVQGLTFGAVVDGYVLTASPSETFAQGRQNDVPTITGGNRHDSGGAAPHPTVTAAQFVEQAKQRYGESADEFLKLYPGANDEQARASFNASLQETMRTSQYLWAMNRAKTAKSDVWVYYWDHALPGPDADVYGAFHTSEVPYVMAAIDQTVGRTLTAKDHEIADTMSSYWANFVKTGNPNGSGLPHWSNVKEKPATAFEVGDTYQSIPVAGSAEKQAFLERAIKTPRPAGSAGR
jgi:para-nitrobenzyl esterase